MTEFCCTPIINLAYTIVCAKSEALIYMSFYIAGTGSALPTKIVSNTDLSAIVDTNDEWISQRTGIHNRHVITNETLTELSVSAAGAALKSANIDAKDIDMIICATLGGDMVTPSAACMVAEQLEINVPSFDINAACSGFIYAFSVAESIIGFGKAKNILVVTCEAMSKIIDWSDRSSCVLFGDGAAAVVLSAGNGLRCTHVSCVPNTKMIHSPSYGGFSPFITLDKPKMGLQMDGGEVYKFAVNTMIGEMEAALKCAKLDIADIDYVLPHQANLRIIEAAKKRFKLGDDKVLTNIGECGNMSATSIAVLLDENARLGKFKKGDRLLFVAFGAGLTAGSLIIEWAK